MARASTRCAAAAKSHPTPEPRTRTRRRARARTRTRSRCGAAARRLRSALTPRCTRCSTRTPTTYASTTAPTSRASCAEPRRRCCKSWGCRPDRSGKARQRPAGGIALLRLAAIYDSIRRGSPVVRCVNIYIHNGVRGRWFFIKSRARWRNRHATPDAHAASTQPTPEPTPEPRKRQSQGLGGSSVGQSGPKRSAAALGRRPNAPDQAQGSVPAASTGGSAVAGRC